MLAGVHVEHEIDERALQLRAQVPVESETGARDFGGALEIQDAELRPEVPVRLGLEIERRGLAPAANLDIIGLALPDRNGLVRNVGDAGQQLPELLVERLHLFVERGDLLGGRAHLLLALGGIDALLPQFGDFGGLGVAAGFQLLGLGDGAPALAIEFTKLIELRRISARREPLRNAVEVVPEVGEIVHVPPC